MSMAGLFDWGFEERHGVVVKADLPGSQVEVEMTEGRTL